MMISEGFNTALNKIAQNKSLVSLGMNSISLGLGYGCQAVLAEKANELIKLAPDEVRLLALGVLGVSTMINAYSDYKALSEKGYCSSFIPTAIYRRTGNKLAGIGVSFLFSNVNPVDFHNGYISLLTNDHGRMYWMSVLSRSILGLSASALNAGLIQTGTESIKSKASRAVERFSKRKKLIPEEIKLS